MVLIRKYSSFSRLTIQSLIYYFGIVAIGSLGMLAGEKYLFYFAQYADYGLGGIFIAFYSALFLGVIPVAGVFLCRDFSFDKRRKAVTRKCLIVFTIITFLVGVTTFSSVAWFYINIPDRPFPVRGY